MSKDLQRVRGFPDRLPQDTERFDFILSQAIRTIKLFDFDRVDTPLLESTNLFVRTLGASSDVVNKEMYSFQKGEEHLTLRPEGTASVARMFIQEKLQQQTPLRLFYYGPMFRHERPQKGRFRQFYQLGIEVLGDDSLYTEAEVISLAWLVIKNLGLSQKITVEINNIGNFEERENYKQDLKKFLTPLSSQLSADSQRRLQSNPLRILDSKEERDQKILEQAPLLKKHLKKESLSRYEELQKKLSQLQIPFKENTQLVRGLDYYNHFVFELTSSHLGSQSGVLAGGRYDSLIQSLGGPETKAIGWAAGLERLMILHDSPLKKEAKIGLVAVEDKGQNQAFQMAHSLREQNYKVHYRFSGNFSKQIKRLNEQQCQVALFFGEKELAQNPACVGVKNMQTEKQVEVVLSELLSYLKDNYSSFAFSQ